MFAKYDEHIRERCLQASAHSAKKSSKTPLSWKIPWSRLPQQAGSKDDRQRRASEIHGPSLERIVFRLRPHRQRSSAEQSGSPHALAKKKSCRKFRKSLSRACPALKVERKTSITYWVEHGKYAVSASELSVFEEILARLDGKTAEPARSPKPRPTRKRSHYSAAACSNFSPASRT